MFTGLVEEVGQISLLRRDGDSMRIGVACDTVTGDAAVGDSVAVNGCCLTITALPPEGGFRSDMMGETVHRTALGDLAVGDPVNLERALAAGARLGGHLVQGHVDGVGTVLAVEQHEEWTTVTYDLPASLAPYVVEKGSITVDGTSLTLTAVTENTFSVGLIPHTLAATIHGRRDVGDRVNLEVDVIAKYVERQLAPYIAGNTA